MTIKGSQKQAPDQALREEAFCQSSGLWLKKPVDLSATEVGSATRRLFEQGAVEQMSRRGANRLARKFGLREP